MSLQHLSSDLLSNIARATNDPTAALDLETAVGSSVFTDQERSTLLADQMEQRMEQALSQYFHAVIELCGALSGAESVEHAVVPRWASDFDGWPSRRAWLEAKEWEHHDGEFPSVPYMDCGYEQYNMWEEVDEQWSDFLVKLSYVNEHVLKDKLGMELPGYQDRVMSGRRLTHSVRKYEECCWLANWEEPVAKALADAFYHPSAESLAALHDATSAMRDMADKVTKLYLLLRDRDLLLPLPINRYVGRHWYFSAT